MLLSVQQNSYQHYSSIMFWLNQWYFDHKRWSIKKHAFLDINILSNVTYTSWTKFCNKRRYAVGNGKLVRNDVGYLLFILN